MTNTCLQRCCTLVSSAQPVAASFGSSKTPVSDKDSKTSFSLEAWLKQKWQLGKGGGAFPWRPTLPDRVRQWLLSPKFQLALQIALGQLWTGLFTVVKQLAFNESCLATVFILAAKVLLAPDPHWGCQLQASSVLLFAALFAPPYAGAIASLARTPGRAFTGTLVAFGIIAFIPLAALRASPGNPGPGIIFALIYGVALINSVTAWPAQVLWHQVIAYLMAAMCISASGAALSAVLVMPTLAGDEQRKKVGQAVQGMGQTLSAYASTLLSADHQPAGKPWDSKKSQKQLGKVVSIRASCSLRNLRKQMTFPEERDTVDRFLKAIRKRTNPDRPQEQPCRLHPAPSMDQLRADLDRAKALLAEVEFEPACLQAGPQDAESWAKLVADAQRLLTRIATLHLLIEGGHLLNSELLIEVCQVDVLPSFRLIFAELAAACKSLGEAVLEAGSKEVPNLLTAMPWQQIKLEMVGAIDAARIGYWSRHRQRASPEDPRTPQALELRALLFLATLTNGLVNALAELERSIPEALGFEAEDKSRKALGVPRSGDEVQPSGKTAALNGQTLLTQQGCESSENNSLRGVADRTTNSPAFVELPNGGNSKQTSSGDTQWQTDTSVSDSPGTCSQAGSKRQASHEQASTSGGTPDALKITIKDRLSHLSQGKLSKELQRQFGWLVRIGKVVSGYDPAMRLKQVFWDEALRTFESKEELLAAFRSKRVQYCFKFWLACSIALTLAIVLSSNFANTRAWRLYYGYITTAIITIERVEAAAWKIVQRLIGTLLGGTLGYLIMLRKGIHTRGAPVLALLCACSFVISQGLHTRLRYTIFLTVLTMTSLTICQFPQCCTPGSDFRLWAARVLNITAGCGLGMTISWLILPWYASDEHLELLASAYVSAGELTSKFYGAFYTGCKAAAEGKQLPTEEVKGDELEGELEAKVVRPVEAVLLGLERDTVIWNQGLFATPPVVVKLTSEMRGLTIRLAALELAVTQGVQEFGEHSASIYTHFLAPMHEENKALMKVLVDLTEACEPILKRGWSKERAASVHTALAEVEECRVNVFRHYQQLRHHVHLNALQQDAEGATGLMTAADSIKLSSWLLAATKVFDEMMLVARIITSEGCRARDNHFTSLVTLSVSDLQSSLKQL